MTKNEKQLASYIKELNKQVADLKKENGELKKTIENYLKSGKIEE